MSAAGGAADTPPTAHVPPAALVVLAAGMGTRMRSTRPKVLHSFAGRSLLGHVLAAAMPLEPARIAVVVGQGRDQVADHLAEICPAATAVVQEPQLGTAHAVAMALDALPELAPDATVMILLGDTPLLTAETLLRLHAVHLAGRFAATVLTAVFDDPTGLGRILRGADGGVERIVEQVDATADERAVQEASSGVFVFTAGPLRAALAEVGSDNAQGEMYLPDTVPIVRAAGGRVGAVVAAAAEVPGVNDRAQLAAVHRAFNDRLTGAFMRSGVRIVDPATTWLDADVDLAPDSVVLPGTTLTAGSSVSAGAQVGPDVTLTATHVGEDAVVTRSVCIEAMVGAGTTVGPYAYLRPGTRVGARAKIGTFVEVKNSEVGDDSKIPHLTYVGDATIGRRSNIGAATVFVNYDGVTKSRTRIGDDARTGADNLFVAPVSVGDGAYTAAGSTIVFDVPPGALGVARARQRTSRAGSNAAGPGRPPPRVPPAPARPTRPTILVTPPRRTTGRVRRLTSPPPIPRDLHSRDTETTHSMSTLQTAGRKSLMLFSGRSAPEFADEIAGHLGVTVTPTRAYDFANGEIFIAPNESVRGCDAFVVQSIHRRPNHWMMETLIMVDALKRASAKRITVVLPFYPYARQDKKHRGREPISARLMADLLKTAGADRIMAVDLHTAQIQGFFDGPVDHLFALPVLAEHIMSKYAGTEFVVVSPDTGRVRMAEQWADRIGGAPIAFIHKTRDPLVPNKVVSHRVVGDVEGQSCLLIDDMIATGGTIVAAAEQLFDAGAREVVIAATHGELSPPATDRLKNSQVAEVVVTNTLPVSSEQAFDKLTVLSVAPLIARAIREVFEDGSVTSLFDGRS